MKRKGFTLVELLITVIVLGIIIGLSLPLVRIVQLQNETKKYETYAEGMTASAKVYTNSYDEDLFGHHDTGCAYIPFNSLVEKELLKDIAIADVTCNHENSFVRVVKMKDQYVYSYSLECEGKDGNVTYSYPEGESHVMNFDICKGREGANISVTTTDSEGYSRRKKTKVILQSPTGIHGDVVIYGAWIKGEENRPNESTEWTRVNFVVPANQEKLILDGEMIRIESEDFVTDSNKQSNGSYYLWIRVDTLKDIYGESWENPIPEEGNYVRGSEFKLDNTPPICTYDGESTTWKTGSRTVEWGCKDEGEGASGCRKKNGNFGAKEENYGSYTFPTTTNINGQSQKTWNFPTYTIKDVAGNTTVCNTKVANIYIDNKDPVCVDTIPKAWVSTNRTITWGCEDEAEGAGCQKGNGTWGAQKEDYGSRTITTDTEKISPSPVTTYKIKDNVGHEVTCDVRSKLNSDGSMPVLVDKTKPTISAKKNPISMGTENYTFTSNINVSYGVLGGTVTCDPASTKKTGVYNVTCTAKNRSNLSASVTFKVQHSYPATAVPYSYCAQEGTCGGGCIGGAWCCPPESPCWGYCCNGSEPGYPCCVRTETGVRYTCPQGGTARGTTCYY